MLFFWPVIFLALAPSRYGTQLVPSWYELVPAGYQLVTSWSQQVPAGTSWVPAGTIWVLAGTQLVPAGTSWYQLGATIYFWLWPMLAQQHFFLALAPAEFDFTQSHFQFSLFFWPALIKASLYSGRGVLYIPRTTPGE